MRRSTTQSRLWRSIELAALGSFALLLALALPASRAEAHEVDLIEHIMGEKDVEILAKNLQDWLAQSGKK